MAKTVNTGFIFDTLNGIKIKSLQCNESNYNKKNSREVSYVVMHYTGNQKDTAKANAEYFRGAGRNASAHFFVGNTKIYQSVELKDVAWHCGAKTYKHANCRNANSIGIEMCCTAGNYRISEKTKQNAAYLCAHICKMLGIAAGQVDQYVLRHWDVTGKICPAQMVKKEEEWKDFKEKVRKLLGSTRNAENPPQKREYPVKITADILHVRKGPGMEYDVVVNVKKGEVYTIVEERTNGTTVWGKLKSGVGYISLGYAARI